MVRFPKNIFDSGTVEAKLDVFVFISASFSSETDQTLGGSEAQSFCKTVANRVFSRYLKHHFILNPSPPGRYGEAAAHSVFRKKASETLALSIRSFADLRGHQ